MVKLIKLWSNVSNLKGQMRTRLSWSNYDWKSCSNLIQYWWSNRAWNSWSKLGIKSVDKTVHHISMVKLYTKFMVKLISMVKTVAVSMVKLCNKIHGQTVKKGGQINCFQDSVNKAGNHTQIRVTEFRNHLITLTFSAITKPTSDWLPKLKAQPCPTSSDRECRKKKYFAMFTNYLNLIINVYMLTFGRNWTFQSRNNRTWPIPRHTSGVCNLSL